MKLRVLSVNIGLPNIIAVMNGEPVISAIAKKPVAGERIFVSALGIDGDGQADLSVHGGFDKAVYAYSASQWPWWEKEHAFACRPATFGENLTLETGDDTEVSIGDRFVWGEAELEVAQPRGPCFKLNIHTNRADTAQLMTLSGHCGFYLRVTREGFAPVATASLERVHASNAASVREAFVALHGKPLIESLKRVLDAPGLAENWSAAVAQRLDSRES